MDRIDFERRLTDYVRGELPDALARAARLGRVRDP